MDGRIGSVVSSGRSCDAEPDALPTKQTDRTAKGQQWCQLRWMDGSTAGRPVARREVSSGRQPADRQPGSARGRWEPLVLLNRVRAPTVHGELDLSNNLAGSRRIILVTIFIFFFSFCGEENTRLATEHVVQYTIGLTKLRKFGLKKLLCFSFYIVITRIVCMVHGTKFALML